MGWTVVRWVRLVKRHGLTLREEQHGQQPRLLVKPAEVDALIERLRAEPERCQGCGEPAEPGREWHRRCATRDMRAREREGEWVPLAAVASELGLEWASLRDFLEPNAVPLRTGRVGKVTRCRLRRPDFEDLR